MSLKSGKPATLLIWWAGVFPDLDCKDKKRNGIKHNDKGVKVDFAGVCLEVTSLLSENKQYHGDIVKVD